MNTQRHGLIATTLFASFVSALVLTTTQGSAQTDAAPARAEKATVHQLPRVVVTGRVQRSEAVATTRIVELPRVVVTGRRVDSVQAVAQSTDRLDAGRL